MESANPFETPNANSDARPPSSPGRFDIGVCFSEAKDATFANLGTIIGGTFLFGSACIFSVITILGCLLLIPVLIWGLNRFHLELIDGRGKVGDLFSGFSSYGSALVSMLLIMLMGFVIGSVGNSVQWIGMAMDSSALKVVGMFASLAWALAVSMRFYFAGLFLVDQQLPAIEAMRASWVASSAQLGSLILLAILSGFIAISGFIALGIGALITVPMAGLMWTSAYRQIVGGRAQTRAAV